MAANPKSPATLEPMDDASSHYHVYHAEAHVISGFLNIRSSNRLSHRATL